MPKSLAEIQKFGKRPTKRAGGKKLDFQPILQKIIQSGQGWGVKEVTEKLCNNVLSRQRVMKLLNAQVATHKLVKFEINGAFYYIDANKVPKEDQPKPKR